MVSLPDIQATEDTRGVVLVDVGVRNLRVPLRVAQRDGGVQGVTGTVDLGVHLPARERGTHMSRLVNVVAGSASRHDALDPMRFGALLDQARQVVGSHMVTGSVAFDFFLHRHPPVTERRLGVPLQHVGVRVEGSLSGGLYAAELQVTTMVTTLCPCSREISDRGAHNQRGFVTVAVRPRTLHGGGAGKNLPPGYPWIEELVEVAEAAGSCEVYPFLKRPDEKHVTERAYDRPRFVEDVVREVATDLAADGRWRGWWVTCRNEESIHQHDAFARASSADQG